MSTVRHVVEVGDQIRFAGGVFTLAGLDGPRCRIVGEDGSVQVLLLTQLYADEDFCVVAGCAEPRRAPVWGPLASLEAGVREKALAWERHIREVETGHPEPDGRGAPREEFDPELRSLAEREAAKAAELTEQGQPVSVATVRRMRTRYRRQGVWGLVDGRTTRARSPWGRADERVVNAIRAALEAQRERSTGTLSRLRRQVGWLLQDAYGPGTVKVPPVATFNRLVHAVADGQGLLGPAVQQRWRTSRPEPPFTPTVVARPGELVMMDSTPLDVLAVLEDGRTGRLELTMAMDVATRSITAAVLRPRGTKAVDAAVLLAQTVVPEPLRPAWPEVLAMASSVIPYERLLSIDARMQGAAARPVIFPSTVVIDQGKVFISQCFLAAAEHLGISVQPCPPASAPAKGHVERGFGSVGTLFAQYVSGYTGCHISRRGHRVEDEACWTLPQLQDLLDEWVVSGWQERRHRALCHPLMPKLALTPNEMWAALVGIAGHVPVPLRAADYIELLPARRCAIGAEGIRFDYRTYDSKALNGHRQRSTAPDGKWEVHYNPYEPSRCWVRLPTGWAEAGWIHRTLVSRPFTDTAWRHIRTVVDQRAGRAEHEEHLARALDELLRRAGGKTAGTRGQEPATGFGAGPTGVVPQADTGVLGTREVSRLSEEEPDQDDADDPIAGTADAWEVFDAHQEAEQW
ncbi:transposase [Streptomyces sp. NPDC007189]|uniref:transposase n=1 Tax=Streptomyces sp. NPDC007189 TaxID=3154315 RepID=UPI003454E8E4